MFPHEVLDAPDLFVQELANKISNEEVEFLRFTGGDIGSDYDAGIVVTDRALINQFLEALRHANGREALGGNRMCYLFIQFSEDAKPVEPTITLRFWPTNEADCFGHEFREALQSLRGYYAKQVSRQVRELASQVGRIEIANHIEHIVQLTDLNEIEEFLQALTEVDSKAFAFTERNESLWIRLHMGDQEIKDFNLLIAISETAEPLTAEPSLPLPLWQYYLQAISWRDFSEQDS